MLLQTQKSKAEKARARAVDLFRGTIRHMFKSPDVFAVMTKGAKTESGPEH